MQGRGLQCEGPGHRAIGQPEASDFTFVFVCHALGHPRVPPGTPQTSSLACGMRLGWAHVTSPTQNPFVENVYKLYLGPGLGLAKHLDKKNEESFAHLIIYLGSKASLWKCIQDHHLMVRYKTSIPQGSTFDRLSNQVSQECSCCGVRIGGLYN